MSTSTVAAATSSSSAPASESSSSPRNTASRPGRDQKQQQQGQKKQQGQSRPKHNQGNSSGSNIGSSATDNNSNNNNNNSSSSRNRNRPGSDSPTVQLSKALSWLLRHNAESQGIAIRADGFCLLSDVMAHSKFKKFTVADVMAVVETNDKKRFEVMEEEITGKDGAVTTKTFIRAVQGHSIKAVEDLGLEPLTDPAMIPTVVHGTLFSKWDLIRGIKFSRTSNGVILSDGLNGDGIIPAQYFLKVMKSSGEQVYPTP
ncbi:hypothetical protein CPB97_005452 [Podila verticillata]|nr:hypothetical protein CPB97_005452 [Podila verticillata]